MKSTIFFAFSLLLILEKQAAVLGFSGGSQGQLPGRTQTLLHTIKGHHSHGPKDTKQAGSQGSFHIQIEEQVDDNDRDGKQKYNPINRYVPYEMNILEKYLQRLQRPLHSEKEGKHQDELEDHLLRLLVHHTDYENDNELQNPDENNLYVTRIRGQHPNIIEWSWGHVARKGQPPLYQYRPRHKHQGLFTIQSTHPVYDQEEDEIQNLNQEDVSANEISEKHDRSPGQAPLHYAHEATPQHAFKVTFPVQNALLVYDEDQNESEYPNQDQGHGQKAQGLAVLSLRIQERDEEKKKSLFMVWERRWCHLTSVKSVKSLRCRLLCGSRSLVHG
ncbi:semenogelin-1 [Eulemur rufifrons]|uniref:semenogelin-1 n=1 Tax=Eulemur rufifrons TaxID=859984 RepID=UPI0037433115